MKRGSLSPEELLEASAEDAEPAEPKFIEVPAARLRRWALGSAYALQPKRLHLRPAAERKDGSHLDHAEDHECVLADA